MINALYLDQLDDISEKYNKYLLIHSSRNKRVKIKFSKMKLKNKKAIVLGGSKGLGREISRNLASLKLKTVVCSRKEIDTSDLRSVEKFYKKHKSVDILVLNSSVPSIKVQRNNFKSLEKYFNQLFLSYFLILKNIRINKGGYVFYISSSIIKEPGSGLILSSSLRTATSSMLKSFFY